MGRLYGKHYEEVRGYRLGDVSVTDFSDVAKENYYALACSILKGWSAEYSLAKMGIGVTKKEYERKKEAPFMITANLAYVLNKFCGLSYKEASIATGIGYHLIRDGVMFVAGKRRKRNNASRFNAG